MSTCPEGMILINGQCYPYSILCYPECPAGFTCVEGVCTDDTLLSKRIEDFPGIVILEDEDLYISRIIRPSFGKINYSKPTKAVVRPDLRLTVHHTGIRETVTRPDLRFTIYYN